MTDQVSIDRISAETMHVPIVGTAPLITHRFSEKAKQKMLDAAQGRSKLKEPQDPGAEYEAAFYRLKGGEGYGFPAMAFKLATVAGARYYEKAVAMTNLRQWLFFRAELGEDALALVRIEGEPVMREDTVRVGKGTSMLRYRPMFTEWSATLEITYVKALITQGSVLSLINAGGMGVGVGDWRPERKGDFGTYQIDPTRDITVTS